MKYNLGFISDDDLYKHVEDTVFKYRTKIDIREFNQNIIDPIKLTFDSIIYSKSIDILIKDEMIRQIDKSNNNHIGYFHQNIFKYIGDKNWDNPKYGFDIINDTKKIYVEMKNKHNTMNSSSSQKTYMRMLNQINNNDESTCMLVEVIATKSQNIPWKISLDGDSISNNNIRRVSIDQFYKIVTLKEYSFYNLCKVLPQVIEDVVKSRRVSLIEDTLLQDFKKLYPEIDLLQALYLLAFQTYEGF